MTATATNEALLRTLAPALRQLERGLRAWLAAPHRYPLSTMQRAALEGAGIPYAVAGGNAVASWVARVDEAAVRNTQDVDILIRREDLDAALHVHDPVEED